MLGQVELDELLSEREKINHELQTILDKQTDPWGIKVSSVEVKHVDLPESKCSGRWLKPGRGRAGKTCKDHPRRRASQQASATLWPHAADQLDKSPNSMQLRYLQTLTEIASERNSTLIFPLPVELLRSFVK